MYSDGNLLAPDMQASLVVGEHPAGILGVVGTLCSDPVRDSEHTLVAGAFDAGFVYDDTNIGGTTRAPG
ncbi:hypothetical protein ACFYYY_21670 [Streptomyces sp. NPDC001834]|uniref:hypothetical protein n=1 Tax=Streptomyces sp. NPDC001834 TaxID=3364616 RepID=UPI0036BB0312